MVHARAWSAWLRVSAPLLLAAPAAQAGITGVCPDGSIFIVQRAADVPCRNARQVEPDEVPPLRPEFLPRPYAWQLFHRQQDPNNPYNLVEAARRVREAAQAGEDTPAVDAPPAPQASQPAPLPAEAPQSPPRQTAMVRSAPEANVAGGLGFSEQEIRDLFLIVELSQQRAPATFAPEEDHALVLRVAQSKAFGLRLREERAQSGRPPQGPVVLFSAIAEAEATFHANLTFVQGHVAFQPDPDDRDEVGLLYGRLGPLAPREAVLGYVVLPAHLDPAQPMDIYWNDRRLTATLRP